MKSFKAGLKEEPEEKTVKEVSQAEVSPVAASEETSAEPAPAVNKQDGPANS